MQQQQQLQQQLLRQQQHHQQEKQKRQPHQSDQWLSGFVPVEPLYIGFDNVAQMDEVCSCVDAKMWNIMQCSSPPASLFIHHLPDTTALIVMEKDVSGDERLMLLFGARCMLVYTTACAALIHTCVDPHHKYPPPQVLARLASNNERQQLAFRLCLNNISQCAANPIMAAKIGLQLYPMAVSQGGQIKSIPCMPVIPVLPPPGFIPMCAHRSVPTTCSSCWAAPPARRTSKPRLPRGHRRHHHPGATTTPAALSPNDEPAQDRAVFMMTAGRSRATRCLHCHRPPSRAPAAALQFPQMMSLSAQGGWSSCHAFDHSRRLHDDSLTE